MHIVLHLATSSDGFIAKSDGDSDWISPVDGELFAQRAKDAGCIVIGKRTFDQYHGTLYPISGVLNIVLTHQPDTVTEKGVIVAHSPTEVIALAKDKGYANILIAGGAKTSEAFLEKGLIDEIFLSVHPIKLGTGMRPFADLSKNAVYKLVGTKLLDDGIREEHYVMV